jgi:cytochrome c-type biogenesis protein CcmE
MDRPTPAPDRTEASPSEGLFHGRGPLLAGGVLLLAALLYFAFVAFQGSTVYYVTVGELLNQANPEYGQRIRVAGKLLPDSFERQEVGTFATFSLTDPADGEVLAASFDGLVPELFFNEHSDIVAEGTYETDGVFHADNIIVKCPSKYASQLERG